MYDPQINMKGIRRSSMIQEVPVNFSRKIVVADGSEIHCLSAPSKRNQNAMKDVVTRAIVFASVFVVFLLRGNTSIFRFNTPNRVTLVTEIESLKQDLQSFEKLKKQYIDEETQLNWDKQHIAESEDIAASILASSRELSERFHAEEHHIKEVTEHMHEHMQLAAKSNANAAVRDHESVINLSRDIQETYKEAKQENQEKLALRRQIAKAIEELQQKNIDVPQDIYDRMNSVH